MPICNGQSWNALPMLPIANWYKTGNKCILVSAITPSIMNILISNLSADIINNDLLKLFAVYGEVGYVAIVRDRKSGRSKGTAFLDMPHGAQGEQAILALNHLMLGGKKITVQEIIYKAGEFNN